MSVGFLLTTLLLSADLPPTTPGSMEDAIVVQTECGKRMQESIGWYRVVYGDKNMALRARRGCVWLNRIIQGRYHYILGIYDYRDGQRSYADAKRSWDFGNTNFDAAEWRTAIWFYLHAGVEFAAATEYFRDAQIHFLQAQNAWFAGWPAGGP